jgi:hypothetical protein
VLHFLFVFHPYCVKVIPQGGGKPKYLRHEADVRADPFAQSDAKAGAAARFTGRVEKRSDEKKA